MIVLKFMTNLRPKHEQLQLKFLCSAYCHNCLRVYLQMFAAACRLNECL